MDAFGDEPRAGPRKPPSSGLCFCVKIERGGGPKKRDNPEKLILDDAYQHLKIKSDLNLLLIDANGGLAKSITFPLGPFGTS
ncbi:MAG: hypothetical protein Ct9H90mP8_0500 [Pseudomonadota bacterium]|nr:MAG: hypothetical protein Ct9H90mP8_0500 [Pseudomonadota bacterium]